MKTVIKWDFHIYYPQNPQEQPYLSTEIVNSFIVDIIIFRGDYPHHVEKGVYNWGKCVRVNFIEAHFVACSRFSFSGIDSRSNDITVPI